MHIEPAEFAILRWLRHVPQEFALAAEKPVPHVLRPGEAPSLPWEVLQPKMRSL